ncbi:MAG: diguanylate cyclase [Dehalococcoidia bacterium]
MKPRADSVETYLRETLAVVDVALNAISDAIVWTDEKRSIQWCNQAFAELVGNQKILLLGADLALVLPVTRLDGDTPVDPYLVDSVSAGTSPRQNVYRTMQGTEAVALEITSAQVAGDRDSRTIVHVIRDISERIRVEDQLRLASVVFESVPQAVVVTDASGEIASVNPAFMNITGYEERDVLGKCMELIASAEGKSELDRVVHTGLGSSGRWDGEIENRRKTGETFPAWWSVTDVRDGNGKLRHYVSVLSDITERKRTEAMLRHLATHDPLTGLGTRGALDAKLAEEVARSVRYGRPLSLLMVDVDHFKQVNDEYGHQSGDEVLRTLGRLLESSKRRVDYAARYGGEEFVLILPETSADDAGIYAERLRASVMNSPVHLTGGASVGVTISIGVAALSGDAHTPELLIAAADQAMYEAKSAGRNRVRVAGPAEDGLRSRAARDASAPLMDR